MVNKKIIIVAVIFSIAAAGSVFWYLSNLKESMDDTVYAQVVVAVEDIPENTVVQSGMIEQMEIPQKYLNSGAVTDTSEAVGKITTEKILAEQQLVEKAVTEEGQADKGPAYAVPEGKRAVSVAVNEVSGVSGLVMPGDYVDVVVTVELEEAGNSVTQTHFVLQGVEVVAVGKNLEADADKWLNREGVENTVTLAVTPRQAQPLVMASEQGSIRLLLRSPVDDGKANLTGQRLKDFLNQR